MLRRLAIRSRVTVSAACAYRWASGLQGGERGSANEVPQPPPTTETKTAEADWSSPASEKKIREKALGSTPAFRDARDIDPHESLVDKRRRLIFQSRYRGMVEMDLIFGHFARCKLEKLDAPLLDEYDVLLKQLDSDLFQWLVMDHEAPKHVRSLEVFRAVRNFVKDEREELLSHY